MRFGQTAHIRGKEGHIGGLQGHLAPCRAHGNAHIGAGKGFVVHVETCRNMAEIRRRTREDIIDQVWDAHWYGPTKTLDVHISALRRKLGHAEWITTIRGVGYRLEVTP